MSTKGCAVCGEEAPSRLASPFVFCHKHHAAWERAPERIRALAFGGGFASVTAIEDFIRRITAEERNSP